MAYYTVSKPTTTYYSSILVSVRTWLTLGNQGLKTWAKLKALSLTTWKTLGDAKWFVTFYYTTANPSTTYYEVT